MQNIEIKMGGPLNFFIVIFLGFWIFLVADVFLGFIRQFFVGQISNFNFLIPLIVMVAFGIALIFVVIPQFVRRIYFIGTQKPVLVFDSFGLHFALPVRGALAWQEIKQVAFLDGLNGVRGLAIETYAPNAFTEKVRSRWRFGHTNNSPNERVIKFLFLELGVIEKEVYEAFRIYQSFGHKFEMQEF